MGIYMMDNSLAVASMSSNDVLVQGFELPEHKVVGIELLELEEAKETTENDDFKEKKESDKIAIHFSSVNSIDVVIEALQEIRTILEKNGDAA